MRSLARLAGTIGFAAGIAALATLAACSSSTGPAASRNNPGTGTSTLKVTADIDANDDPTVIGGFVTEYTASLRDGVGNKVSSATVTMSNPNVGTFTLPETAVGSGDYFISDNRFPSGDFTLNVVRGSDIVQNVVLGGPAVHTITAPLKNATVPANQPLTVRWTVPSQATQAEVETLNFPNTALPDTGAYVIPGAFNPPRPDQRIRVFRFNEVNIAGGLSGSRLRVQVRNTVQPVIVQ